MFQLLCCVHAMAPLMSGRGRGSNVENAGRGARERVPRNMKLGEVRVISTVWVAYTSSENSQIFGSYKAFFFYCTTTR